MFTFSFVCRWSTVMLYHFLRPILEMNWYFLFPLTELETLSLPFLLREISGILSPCLQQWLVPPFPLKAKILDQPCLPLPFTLEWMIRSKLTLNSGPQLSIVPISLFLLMSPASSIDKHSLAILSSLCSFLKSIVYAMTSSYIPLQETNLWVRNLDYFTFMVGIGFSVFVCVEQSQF